MANKRHRGEETEGALTDHGKAPCCSPVGPGQAHNDGNTPDLRKTAPCDIPRVTIPGGTALIGTAYPQIADDGEAPLRKKRVSTFLMSTTTVTNRQFAEFVEDTRYQTDAERIGWSFVFHSEVPPTTAASPSVPGAEWWRRIDGANWKDINGPGTFHMAWHADHPVVHVSWNDARVFAAWAGGRLPSEIEWEHAARGAVPEDVRFPWGDAEPNDIDRLLCNIWQGRFPYENTEADGWAATALARSFEPNAAGLYNMVGNVWEWTADVYTVKSLKKAVRSRLNTMKRFKVLKGGSFLCHRSYCYRYRIAARTGNSADSTTSHQGFRLAWDATETGL